MLILSNINPKGLNFISLFVWELDTFSFEVSYDPLDIFFSLFIKRIPFFGFFSIFFILFDGLIEINSCPDIDFVLFKEFISFNSGIFNSRVSIVLVKSYICRKLIELIFELSKDIDSVLLGSLTFQGNHVIESLIELLLFLLLARLDFIRSPIPSKTIWGNP